MEHAAPLPFFEDMLKEEYLWSEVYNEYDDCLRYEYENFFPDNLFYSFYYYSFEVLKIYREEFIQFKRDGICRKSKSTFFMVLKRFINRCKVLAIKIILLGFEK